MGRWYYLDMKHVRGRAGKVLSLSFFGVLAALTCIRFWPRLPSTEVWTSKAIDSRGTRAVVNIPRGWKLYWKLEGPEVAWVRDMGSVSATLNLSFSSMDKASSWPRWLRWMLPADKWGGDVHVSVLPAVGIKPDGKERLKPIRTVSGKIIYVSEMRGLSPDGRYELWVDYICEDERFFDATHNAVSASRLVTK